jgi:hypothetical protein
MIAITALQKRLDKLEPRPTTEPDIVSLVLTTLADSDIDLLQELASLRESGFDEGQTAQMMGSRYKQAQKAVVHFQKAYQEISSSLFERPTKKRTQVKRV